jgi:nitrous oxidase accessory protein
VFVKQLHITCFFWFLALTVQAQVREVCATCTYTVIQDAISAAEPGETVLIKSGEYCEGNILVDKPLYLIGEGNPVIDGENETEILTVTAHGVHIEGLTLRNVGTSYIEDRAGIRIKKARDFVIQNNRLENTFFGIYLEHAARGVVRDNIVTGQASGDEASAGNAIHLWYCKRIRIEGNLVEGHRDGIYFEFVDSSTVYRNVSRYNLRYGLHFMFSNYDEYVANEFRQNGAGVAVMFSKQIRMEENLFTHNWGRASYGLLLKEIYDADIEHNVFEQNTIGIYVEGSTRMEYHHNVFSSNGWAMKISGGCLDNRITANNFRNNTFDLTIASQVNNNVLDGNYWSEYSGYDLDKDGTGDVPFRPVKLFSFVVNQTPESIVLLRSLFVDLINFSEKVSPVFTPENVQDAHPLMRPLPIPLLTANALNK